MKNIQETNGVTKLHVTIATIFPQIFPGPLALSLLGKGLATHIWTLNILNIRDYAIKGRIDDKPFGGLPGMVITAPVIESMIENNKAIYKWDQIYYTNPRGARLTQEYIQNIMQTILSKVDNYYSILIICGRYEGIDHRLIEYYNMKEFSLGDFILCGGELAAFALIEALVRLLPGILGNLASIERESFSTNDYLQSPRYTTPRLWKNKSVPSVLLSGHHGNIKKY